MSLEIATEFEPNEWQTKLYCAYCSELFPLRFLDDHAACCEYGAPHLTLHNSIRMCSLAVEDETFFAVSHPGKKLLNLVRLFLHGDRGYFFGEHFVWSNSVVWAPRWVVEVAHTQLPKKDKDIVLPLAAKNVEIRKALESLLYMTDRSKHTALVRRFLEGLIEDGTVAQIYGEKPSE